MLQDGTESGCSSCLNQPGTTILHNQLGTITLAQLAWQNYPGTTTLALLSWHNQPGTISLAQLSWHNYPGTTIQAQLAWDNYPGTSSLAQLSWHNYPGTTILAQLGWRNYLSKTILASFIQMYFIFYRKALNSFLVQLHNPCTGKFSLSAYFCKHCSCPRWKWIGPCFTLAATLNIV